MNHVITTYGGGELFALVFNGIAALFNTNGTGLVIPLIRVGLMVGSVYVLLLMLFRYQLEEGIRWLIWVVIATNLIFLPKTTIYIHDPLTNERFRVDHIPFALGVFASSVSQIGKTITEKFESVFTLPDYMPYHETGTVFASSIMSQLGKFQIVDPVFKGNMERFVNQCVVYDAMIGHKYTLTDLQHQSDLWNFVRHHASPVLGFQYKEPGQPGNVTSCQEGAQRLNRLWADEVARATALYGSRVQNRSLNQQAFNTYLMASGKLLSGVVDMAGTASDMIRQEMMIHALEEGSNNKLSELGAPSNYAATKALLQQRSTYAVAGEIAARTLPLFKNVIEALSYALFIFIVVLALLPNGYKSLLTYAGILVWTQLWAPLYAVLNLVMTLYGRAETHHLIGAEGLTLLNSSALINAHTDMVTLAAWFAVSIPFISYGILKQGASAFVGLAHHLGSAMQSAASSAASETVSGNISLGNVSLGTQAYQNKTAFQQTTSPSLNTSQFKALSASGVEQSTFGDGKQSFTEQALSRLSVQILGTENTTFAQESRLNDAKSVAQSKSLSAGQSTEAALQDSTSFLSRLNQEEYSGQDFHKSTNTSESTSLQNFKSYVNDIRQSTGLNEAQATEAAIGASIGSPKLLGIGASGSFSSSAQRHQAIDSAKSIAEQTGYSENIERVISAAQSQAQGNRDSKGAELGTNAMASLHQSKSQREESSVAQNNVQALSQDISSHQSKGMSINKDLTQEVLDFIAHQPINTGPDGMGGTMGYKVAQQIIEQGGKERSSYLQQFQDQHPQYKIQSVDHSREEQGLNSNYERAVQETKDTASLAPQHTANKEEIINRGKQANLDLGHTPSQAIKEEVAKLQVEKTQTIQDKKKTIDAQENTLKKEQTAAKEKNMTTSVLKNAVKNIVGEEKKLPADKTPKDWQIFKR